MKNVAFRVDSSTAIGSGHLMRCLNLAEALRKNGVKSAFFCAELKGGLTDEVRKRGFDCRTFEVNCTDSLSTLDGELRSLSANWERDANETLAFLQSRTQVDVVVVDHYALDGRWESLVGSAALASVFAIDDLADRPHVCAMLLDQNYYHKKSRYECLVPTGCEILEGPAYALLAEQFAAARAEVLRLPVNSSVNRILVYFGASDIANQIPKVVAALGSSIFKNAEVTVVAGIANPNLKTVREAAKSLENSRVLTHVADFSALMRTSDLFIGAGGATSYERLCLGLPSLVVSVAENQRQLSEDLATDGYTVYLGSADLVSEQNICEALDAMTFERRSAMQSKGMKLVDGAGTKRVVEKMMGLTGRS